MSDKALHASGHQGPMSKKKLVALSIGSVGVVYGDIGTSPLYAFREALRPVSHDGVQELEIIGLISLFFWALTIIVTLKYVIFLLRADNDGEGGTLALLSLVTKAVSERRAGILFIIGVVGASLFLGDAMITPALTVLSSVEGLKLVAPGLQQYVVPISVVILVILFAVQSRGTGAVSAFFGPIMMIWFLILGSIGVYHIFDDISVLRAFNPYYGVWFLIHSGFVGFIVLGSVFLAVTGAEALYADLGHFGRSPIRLAWFGLIFPALILNYLGQGAFVLGNPAGLSDPFFLMFPETIRLPVVIMATIAGIIASQSVITGAFSLARQAIHLGFLPRMEIYHTSETNTGQIYLPAVNTILLFGVMALVLMFRSSEALAVAYGIAVTGDMVVTTILFYNFVRVFWKWSVVRTLMVVAPLFFVESIFLGSNLTKLHHGGYVPVLIASCFIVIMWTWRRGTRILFEKTRRTHIPLASFVKSLEKKSDHGPIEVPGTAIFLTSDPTSTPAALLHNLKHNHVIHSQNIVLTIKTQNRPRVPVEERGRIERISEHFQLLELNFGFQETQNVSQALAHLRKAGLKFDIMSTSFYLGRRKLIPDANSGMPVWQDRLFIALATAATDPSDYFRLPANRVVELGAHVTV
ncbi:potassium transporter Kup [Rhizobium sp. KVB221]|uniref:Probable potassium transport system protein Kup n=1 Tax=Rhizobium setariae TaxID=2801340 RepID=A0A937CJ54_9HYPH|nr:potassium transporter Kup [Rhizobium setariae]MBL0370745.1 potassium transporter Kup [Rhizobium setariae]